MSNPVPKYVALIPREAGKVLGVSVLTIATIVIACEHGVYTARFDSTMAKWNLEPVALDEETAEKRNG